MPSGRRSFRRLLTATFPFSCYIISRYCMTFGVRGCGGRNYSELSRLSAVEVDRSSICYSFRCSESSWVSHVKRLHVRILFFIVLYSVGNMWVRVQRSDVCSHKQTSDRYGYFPNCRKFIIFFTATYWDFIIVQSGSTCNFQKLFYLRFHHHIVCYNIHNVHCKTFRDFYLSCTIKGR